MAHTTDKSMTLTDQAEEQLVHFIIDQEFRPGDPLPTETSLAERLGVSRPILREAMSRLRMFNVIETRTRRGAVVAKPDLLTGFERLLEIAMVDETTAREILELRVVFEVGHAPLVFLRRTEQDLDELEEIAEASMEPDIDYDTVIERNIQFHSRLFAAAGNELLARFQKIVAPFFYLKRRYHYGLKSPDRPSLISHRDLVHLLRGDSLEAFADGMLQHLRAYLIPVDTRNILPKRWTKET